VRQLDAGLDKRGIEREAAAQQEGDEVLAPQVANVVDLAGEIAVAKTRKS
jgi:hypothetical protein